ncbi:protein kinase, partial [Mycobacterium sp. ITM-2017-0098]
GDPQLSDFGTARIVGGYKTVTGFFTGTLSYTAPEVLTGKPPTVVADVYSLGATLYALIAGKAAHERNTDEELIAHYLRITSQPVPDLRHLGIPSDVCSAIEKAMSLDPTDRFDSAAEFGRTLQEAQRHNGLTADVMAISEATAPAEQPEGTQALPLSEPSYPSVVPPIPVNVPPAPPPAPPPPDMFAQSPSNTPWNPPS